jgi:hypothetical protein
LLRGGAARHNRDVRLLWLVWFAYSLPAQPLRVFSEFARIDSSGEVTSPAHPREILSPAIARNAFTSFQVVVHLAKGTRSTLYIGQNPDDSVRVTVYREAGERLELVDLPYECDGTQVFWMDLWTAPEAPVRRIKVEPQLSIHDEWVVYPMEVRVMDAIVPGSQRPEGSSSPAAVMKSFLCGTKPETNRGEGLSIPRLRFRNAQQDVALARRAASEGELRRLLGGCDASPPAEPEWYLRIRDYLFRMR